MSEFEDEVTVKQAILLHGTGGNEKDYFWFADTKKYLELHGFSVWWPTLPNPERPELHASLNYLENNYPLLDDNSIIIAHSSACPLVLTFLQYLQKPICQAVLVSGFYQEIDNKGFSKMMLQHDEYDWQAIKNSVKEIVFINSDNDPWGCDDKQARPVAKKLNATFILADAQGHMGSDSFNQPYREFPALKQLLFVAK